MLKKLLDISLVTKEQKQKMIYDWNKTDVEYDTDKSVYQLFKNHALNNPEHIAIESSNGKLTYGELNVNASKVANKLIKLGLKKGMIVSIYFERSIEMITAILGILKAGGAYLPIDPDYPINRVDYILNNSKVDYVLTQDKFTDRLEQFNAEIITVDKSMLENESELTSDIDYDSNDLMYVIYTSGSTGNPKGVQIEHKSLLNLVDWQTTYYNISKEDRSSLISGPAFDASVWELWPYLTSGGTICIPDDDIRLSAQELQNWLINEKITMCYIPTSYVNLYIESDWSVNTSIRYMLTGGDKLHKHPKTELPFKLVNHYGPTEATILATAAIVEQKDDSSKAPSIGKPINNTQIYILDKNMKPVPCGVAGEIYIGGIGVARGYLYNDVLTRERFIENPFIEGSKVYKTGDLGKLDKEGNIEFIGRTDKQIQIRGYRVELEEVESVIGNLENLRDIAVIAADQGDNDKKLVAFIVTNTDNDGIAEEVKASAKAVLPEYMVPSMIFKLDSMPMTPNGKIDYKKLESMDLSAYSESENANIELVTQTEKILADIWKNIFGKKEISRIEDFFMNGGHSIIAGNLVAKINNIFNINFPIRKIFENSRLIDIAREIDLLRNEGIGKPVSIEILSKDSKSDELSFAQQRLWFMNNVISNKAVYNIPCTIELDGKLDIMLLKESVQEIVNRHESLRTNFVDIDGTAKTKILDNLDFNIKEIDLVGKSHKEHELKEHVLREVNWNFDLSSEALMRVTVIKTEEEKALLLVVFHHIISDGWSVNVFMNELTEIYKAKESNLEHTLEDIKVQYSDFTVWQRKVLDGELGERQLSYWEKKLENHETSLEINTDRPLGNEQTYSGSSYSFNIDKNTYDRLSKFSTDNNVTLFMTLLGAFQTTLYKYSGQRDLIVGSPVAGRNHSETEPLIGFFVNMLPLRTEFPESITFEELVGKIRSTTLDAFDNQDVPFEQIVDKVVKERNLNISPIFQVTFALQNATSKASKNMGSVKFNPVEIEDITSSSKFNITLSMEETEEGISGFVEYNSDLFDKSTIVRMMEHLKKICNMVIDKPSISIDDIDILLDEEIEIIATSNSHGEIVKDRSVHKLFEEAVLNNSDKVALEMYGESLTYNELNIKSNKLAHYLKLRGVEQGTNVAICMDRSIDMILGLLSILKIGATYVPVDPAYPSERIEYMIEDSNPSIIITTEKYKEKFNNANCDIVFLESNKSKINEMPIENLNTKVDDENIAYIIYTSGSTGKPKGVKVPHRAIYHVICDTNYLDIEDKDILLQVASVSFDAATFEIWGSLCNGAKLVIVNKEDLLDIAKFSDIIKEKEISVMFITTALFNVLIDYKVDSLKGIRKLLFGGERVSVNHVKKAIRELGPDKIIHVYGPTETAVFATYYPVNEVHEEAVTVPIGYPLSTMKLYVLTESMKNAPIGVTGELYIGGTGVASGYLNRADLTETQFVMNPFDHSETLYKTGDLVRRLPGGEIEFIGRRDNQVKIRGFRIETGEIELAIGEYPSVKDTVVIVREDKPGDKKLVAYIVCSEEYEEKEIRTFIKNKLPDYMMPSMFVNMDKLPLTPNGKVDVRKLPKIEYKETVSSNKEVTLNKKEEKLVKIWCEILGLKHVDINDNFFQLGGDSILSIQLVAKARNAGLEVTPKQLFEYQTIKYLAENIAEKEVKTGPQTLVSGDAVLTPIQSWFVEQDLEQPHHFNQSMMFNVPHDVDVKMLEETVKRVISHHDALRINLVKDKINKQINKVDFEFKLDVEDLSKLDENSIKDEIVRLCNNVQSSLNLEEGLLVKGLYVKLKDNSKGKLLIVIHHMVVDGVSWRIISEDLNDVYSNLVSENTVNLPMKTTAYIDWANKLSEYLDRDDIEEEVEYWNQILNVKTEDIPTIGNTINNFEKSAVEVHSLFTKEDTKMLLSEIPKKYHTEINDILLTALYITMKDWIGSDIVKIHLEGHGREDIIDDVDLSRTVGWFTSIYPVALTSYKCDDFIHTLNCIKGILRNIPNKGVGYSILKHLNQSKDILLSEESNIDVSFNYLGQFNSNVGSKLLLEPSNENCGLQIGEKNRRNHLIDVVGSVNDGLLEFNWIYCKEIIDETAMEELSKKYVSVIKKFIDMSKTEDISYIPSDFPEADLNQEELDYISSVHKDIDDIYILSPLQEGMLYQNQLDKNDGNYVVQFVATIKGNICLENWEKAWKYVVSKYSILRTSFIWEKVNKPHQIVHKENNFKIDYIGSKDALEGTIDKYLAEDRTKGYKLSDIPFRITMLDKNKDEHVFIWSIHHILVDGWSWPIIWNEVMNAYYSLDKYNNIPLTVENPYKNYIKWISEQDKDDAKSFWKEQLEGFYSPTELPGAKIINNMEAEEICNEELLTLTQEETSKISKWAKDNQITMNTFLQGAWSLLISKYTGDKDLVFGSVVSGRPPELAGVEEMVGLFINNLPTRVKIKDNTTVVNWLQELQESQLKMRQYGYTSLSDIRDWSEVSAGSSLFNSIYAFENYPISDESEDESSLEIGEYSGKEQTNYPLVLIGLPSDTLQVKIQYRESCFSKEVIEQILMHLKVLMDNMIKIKDITPSKVSMLSKREEEMILSWNNTSTDYPRQSTIAEIFEKQVILYPDSVALQMGNEQLTYKELNERANILANKLLETNVTPGSRVSICMKRSTNMITSMLAILKVGAVYVPIDPEYPKTRKDYMIDNTGTEIMLSDPGIDLEINESIVKLEIDEDTMTSDVDSFKENIKIEGQPGDMAYIIYTSGSTGKPKGVCITNRSVIRLVKNTNYVDITNDDVFLQASTVSFDAATFEIWGSLLNGAKLVLVSELTPTLNDIASSIKKYGITTMWLTSGLFNIFVENNLSDLDGVKNLLVGGDVVSIEHARKALDLPGLNLINGYGPTENTTFTCWHPINIEDTMSGAIPIGKPISNTKVYILDSNLDIAPINTTGELYISGDGLSTGYLNDHELTKEKHINNPFNKNELLYKSGDLVSWDIQGNIHFKGRVDNQVKVNGYRIEVEEIEKITLGIEEVNQAVVVTRKNKDNLYELVLYVVSNENISTDDVKDYLIKKIPRYMIPSRIIKIDDLKLTINGKVDRKALLSELNEENSKVEILKPKDQVEEEIYTIWKEVLNENNFGVTDNFYDLGGHSLKSLRIISKVEEKFNVRISVNDFYNNLTILELSEFIKLNASSGNSIIDDEHLVLIRSSKDSDKKIFVFHGGNGEIYANVNFIGNLQYEAEYWGIRMNGFKPFGEQYDMNELASAYIESMKKIQKNGPYQLMGWSFGGNIIIEVANQLEKMGEIVENLYIFDSIPPKGDYEGKIDEFTIETEVAFIYENLKPLSNLLNRVSLDNVTVSEFWSDFINIVESDDNYENMLKKIKEDHNIKLFLPNHEEISFKCIVDYLTRSRKLSLARDGYEPERKVNADVTVLKATEGYQIDVEGWIDYFNGKASIYNIVGTHETMFQEENIEENTSLFNKILLNTINKVDNDADLYDARLDCVTVD